MSRISPDAICSQLIDISTLSVADVHPTFLRLRHNKFVDYGLFEREWCSHYFVSDALVRPGNISSYCRHYVSHRDHPHRSQRHHLSLCPLTPILSRGRRGQKSDHRQSLPLYPRRSRGHSPCLAT